MSVPITTQEQSPASPASYCRWASVAAITHPGLARPRNEDAVLVGTWWSQDRLEVPRTSQVSLQTPLLCLVADGLGGHGGGDAASRLAVEALSREPERLGRGESAIVAALLAIHQQLLCASERQPAQSAPGTTVAGLVLEQQQAWVFNVGDSRVYRYRDGFLAQLSTDDVPNPSYGDSGEQRTGHRITQCLGICDEAPAPHIQRIAAADGDLFLLCSDGLTAMLDIDTIEAIIAAEPASNLGATVAALTGAALTAGGLDNLSIILVRAVREAASMDRTGG